MRARLPRVVFVAFLAVLVFAGLTYAAQQTVATTPPQVAPAPLTTAPQVLIVPDVRGQAFVFAKGMIQDAGFAWHVTGSVGGFAVNTVATQRPTPGTRVIDTGAPVLTLTLAHNKRYKEHGQPENDSPFHGTAVRLAPISAELTPLPATTTREPQATAPATTTAPAATTVAPKNVKTVVVLGTRPPAFVVKGAPKEPQKELALPVRAGQLSAWLTPGRKPTNANVRYWLYQHTWIVTGAGFGWWKGAEALKILIAVDKRVVAQWGIGRSSEAVALRTLTIVQARSR